ncbi:MAG: hypothetical protein P8L85_05010 [Rubripirellula sp.]|nr:hypothetical protein [Rubripirellula sp.]
MSVNVVERLKQQLRRADALGLAVRMEMLADQQATWCEIAGVPTLFVDLSQTAAEQLKQVEETLDAFSQVSPQSPDRGWPQSPDLARAPESASQRQIA